MRCHLTGVSDGYKYPCKYSILFLITLSVLYISVWNIDIINLSFHVLNFVYVVTDMFISGVPVRMLDVYQPMTFYTIYAIFTILYWMAGGTNLKGDPYIYHVLNYGQNFGLAMLVLAGVIFGIVPLLHTSMYGLYKLRIIIYNRWYSGKITCEMNGKSD